MGRAYGGVYVAEIDDPIPFEDPLDEVDSLIRRVRETPLLFCVLGGSRHGTRIGTARTSYFEIELFQAALLQRPVHVFEYEGFAPSPLLQGILDALKPCLQPVQWTTVKTDKAVLELVEKALAAYNARTLKHLPLGLPQLATTLWRMRARQAELVHEQTPVRWLNSKFIGGEPPNMSVISGLLAAAKKKADREFRLARLWMAIRELMAAPYTDPNYSSYRAIWAEALSEWWSASSWYGLHGHALLGPLAAGKTVEDIRSALRSDPIFADAASYPHPAGGLASSHYSIAKLLTDRAGRNWHFDEAERQVTRGLAEAAEEKSNLLLLRGSISLRRFRPWAAIPDYAKALDIREKRRDPSHEIGVALAELGFAYVTAGRLFKGRDFLDRGVELLIDAPEQGFLLRARRKLVLAKRLTGRWRAARILAENNRIMAEKSSYLDQVRQM